MLPLVEGREHGWPAWTVALAWRLAPVLLGAFAPTSAGCARRGGEPLLDPALFRARARSRAGLLPSSVFWCGQASFFLVLALYLQHGRGLDALQAGLRVHDPRRSRISSPRCGRPRWPRARPPVIARGRADAGRRPRDPARRPWRASASAARCSALAPGLLLVGAGMGLRASRRSATTCWPALRPSGRAPASGALATMQNVGNALGVALVGVDLLRRARTAAYAPRLRAQPVLALRCALLLAAADRLLPGAHRGRQ